MSSVTAQSLGKKQFGLGDNFGDRASVVADQPFVPGLGNRASISGSYPKDAASQGPELAQKRRNERPGLPPGVVAVRPDGLRDAIFWIHYPCLDLAKELGESQPFFFVMLTPADCALLGENPTLQSIGACLLRKILAAQPNGPYTIGGYCLGGILAYEIAYQLRAVGHEVSFLVMLDPPNPSSVPSCDTLSSKARYVRYLLKRAMRLGVRTSLIYFQEHLLRWLGRPAGITSAKPEVRVAQEMSEAAMFKYQPKNYDGRVLLLLAAERPPHVDVLPSWEAVITGKLDFQYLDAHHRDLPKTKGMRAAAAVIGSQLAVAHQEKSFPRRGGNSRLTLLPAMSRSNS